MLFNIYFVAPTSAYYRDLQAQAYFAICDSDQSRKKTSLAVNEENIMLDVDKSDEKD